MSKIIYRHCAYCGTRMGLDKELDLNKFCKRSCENMFKKLYGMKCYDC